VVAPYVPFAGPPRERHPEVGVLRKRHNIGHHADHRVQLGPKTDGFADRRQIAAEPSLPHVFSDDHDMIAGRIVVARIQKAPSERRGAEYVKILARRGGCAQSHRLTVADQCGRHPAVNGHV
jgi:hypothetical protein